MVVGGVSNPTDPRIKVGSEGIPSKTGCLSACLSVSMSGWEAGMGGGCGWF